MRVISVMWPMSVTILILVTRVIYSNESRAGYIEITSKKEGNRARRTFTYCK